MFDLFFGHDFDEGHSMMKLLQAVKTFDKVCDKTNLECFEKNPFFGLLFTRSSFELVNRRGPLSYATPTSPSHGASNVGSVVSLQHGLRRSML